MSESGGMADRYLDTVAATLARARSVNAASIRAASRLVADAIESDGIVHLFGTGHSQLLAMEAVERAGGFGAAEAIIDAGFGRAEKLEGYAAAVASTYHLAPPDVLVVISNSGRNAAPIEMALLGRAAGLPVIALTSVEFSRGVASRHSSGARLVDVADVVLDMCGAPGDAAIELEGISLRVGPTSTVVGAALLQAVFAGAAEELLRRGIEPAVFRSQNTDDAAAHNEALRARYGGRVRPLG